MNEFKVFSMCDNTKLKEPFEEIKRRIFIPLNNSDSKIAIKQLKQTLIDEDATGFVYRYNLTQKKMNEVWFVTEGKAYRYYKKIEGQGCPFK